MTQSRAMSLFEALANVIVGYALAIATQIAVFPWFGIEAAFGDHLMIGLAFVGISLMRGYLLRRVFEGLRKRKWACDSLAQLKAVRSAQASTDRRAGRPGQVVTQEQEPRLGTILQEPSIYILRRTHEVPLNLEPEWRTHARVPRSFAW